MAELMPTSLPSRSSSGPPELPGLIAASVWMKSWIMSSFAPGSRTPARLLADTMPLVTVLVNPNGEPMATTQSPTSSASESPNGTVGSFSPLSTSLSRITARSVSGSRPASDAVYSRPSLSFTLIVSAGSTTWLFVRMMPDESTSTPDPKPTARSTSLFEGRTNQPSEIISGSRRIAVMCTTAGSTDLATRLNARESDRADCTSCGEAGSAA